MCSVFIEAVCLSLIIHFIDIPVEYVDSFSTSELLAFVPDLLVDALEDECPKVNC